MEGLKKAFARAKSENRTPLVAYVTAGYPKIAQSVDILLAMEAGGADIIELGLPFTDPIADGPTIQLANTQALENGTGTKACLKMVRDARARGLRAPVVFMGYYNPLLAYGEERMFQDAKSAGVNGFIMVDLPPEEAVRFRQHCTTYGLSYVPLIAPATSEKRMKLLCGIADSFIYVVSRMGVTGATGVLSSGLPDLLERVHKYSKGIPAAVGFGEHSGAFSRSLKGRRRSSDRIADHHDLEECTIRRGSKGGRGVLLLNHATEKSRHFSDQWPNEWSLERAVQRHKHKHGSKC